nr:MAG TPA: hypothetical protein [Caudoviricetes sp.]
MCDSLSAFWSAPVSAMQKLVEQLRLSNCEDSLVYQTPG